MKFSIAPIIDGKLTRLQVDLIHSEEFIEHFKVSARNKSFVLQTNRLLFKSKGLKFRKGQWKIINGNMHNTNALEKIIKEIEKYLEKIK
jgi:hypothetical protein